MSQVIKGGLEHGLEYRVSEIGIDLPGVAQRSVAVREVKGVPAVSRAFRKTGAVGDDEIVFIAEMEFAYSQRHERYKGAVMASGYGKIQETCLMNILHETTEGSLLAVKQGVDVSRRKQVYQNLQDALRAAVLIKIVVNQRNLHR